MDLKKGTRRKTAFFLIFLVIAGMFPQFGKEPELKAAVGSVSLSNLGKVGTLSVGSKTKKDNWWKLYLGSSEMFCLNLGATCHAGDVYQSEDGTYSSGSGGKKGKEACIGYWFDKTKKRSNKAYIMAQALFWAVEEGETSESELKAVIGKIKEITGYYSSQSVSELYRQIFEPDTEVTIRINLWKYKGSGSKRQILLDIETGSVVAKPKSLCSKGKYRQRILIRKVDEHGMPLAKVTFRLQAHNIDELYFFKAKGWGEEEQGEIDDDADHFELETMTDKNGKISYRFNYHLQSEDYYYYDDDELASMDAAAKKEAARKLDEEGYRYGKGMTKQAAQKLSEEDLHDQMDHIKNEYTVQEIASEDQNLYIDPEYAKGKSIVLGKENSWEQIDGEWPDATSENFGDYEKAYHLMIINRFKKVSVKVVKKDSVSRDGKAHGDATLDGAVFQLYEDAACTKPAKVFEENREWGVAGPYATDGGKFVTDYLQSGREYYLKESKAPRGYKKTDKVIKITADGKQYQVEYSKEESQYEVDETPIRGKIAIQKYCTDGTTGPLDPERGAEFEIYLASAGSYEKADEYERDRITTDKDGYACSKELYFGRYKVRQISSGEKDTELQKEFYVYIDDENRKIPYTFIFNDRPFGAYLRVIKKDSNTKKEVLKPGTTYQIYRVDKKTGQQSLVKQSYSDGYDTRIVDRFQSDNKGRIMTVDSLPSGTYRIYETEAVSGLCISKKFIEVEINSKKENYVRETDSEGRTYTTVTLDYENDETYGKLSVFKTGQQLKGFKDGKFVYEESHLKGARFEIYAEEDILTQDNQATNWFDKDALVGSITTGTGAVFTSECGGITGYTMDEDGTVTVHLPLGRYRIVEKETTYGYVLPEHNEWKVEFTWKDQEDEYVLNATDSTDGNGVMKLRNERARAALSLTKMDQDRGNPVAGAVFGIYSKDPIYNAEGKKIVEADAMLGTVETAKDGTADFDLDLPLMSEHYTVEQAVGENQSLLNSGDYYVKEERVSDSYYSSDIKYPVHLEYKDAHTPLITWQTTVKNRQTRVLISKISAAGSGEIPGCHLQITDQDGRCILSWISGNQGSVRIGRQISQEYQNLQAEMDGKGNLQVSGLLHDRDYMLTETRPADGYVTADTIAFRLTENKTASGSVTRADIRGKNGIYQTGKDDVVRMVDEQTKILFQKFEEKSKRLLAGAQIGVFDITGKQVASFITKSGTAEELRGILSAGKTYIFRELEAPRGYKKAADLRVTIKDTKEPQVISMTDKRVRIVTGKVPKTAVGIKSKKTPKIETPAAKKPVSQPDTGFRDEHRLALILLFSFGTLAVILGRNRYRRRI